MVAVIGAHHFDVTGGLKVPARFGSQSRLTPDERDPGRPAQSCREIPKHQPTDIRRRGPLKPSCATNPTKRDDRSAVRIDQIRLIHLVNEV